MKHLFLFVVKFSSDGAASLGAVAHDTFDYVEKSAMGGVFDFFIGGEEAFLCSPESDSFLGFKHSASGF